jgi:predicted nucleotidyltransferase
MKREEIIRLPREHQEELRRDLGVRSLALFGSVAREEARDASDVDLLVEFDRPIGLLHLIGTRQHIEDLLGVKKVDLVLRRCVYEELKQNILGEAIDVFQAEKVEIPPAAHSRGMIGFGLVERILLEAAERVRWAASGLPCRIRLSGTRPRPDGRICLPKKCCGSARVA